MPCTPNIMYIMGADCNLYFKSRTGLQFQVFDENVYSVHLQYFNMACIGAPTHKV